MLPRSLPRGLGRIVWLCVLAWPLPVSAHSGVHQALAILDARMAQRPQQAGLHLERADLLRDHGEWEAALADCDEARRLDPELAEVDFYAGRILLDSSRAAEAEQALERLLEKEPWHAGGRLFLARALVALDRPAEAAAQYTAALGSLEPAARPSPDVYLERARAQAALGELAEALEGLDEGIERLGAVTLQLEAVELEIRRQSWDSALQRLERLTARAGRKERYLARRGEILELAGRPEEAVAAWLGAWEAIEALPPARRNTRSMRTMVQSVGDALQRLRTASDEGGRRGVQRE